MTSPLNANQPFNPGTHPTNDPYTIKVLKNLSELQHRRSLLDTKINGLLYSIVPSLDPTLKGGIVALANQSNKSAPLARADSCPVPGPVPKHQHPTMQRSRTIPPPKPIQSMVKSDFTMENQRSVDRLVQPSTRINMSFLNLQESVLIPPPVLPVEVIPTPSSVHTPSDLFPFIQLRNQDEPWSHLSLSNAGSFLTPPYSPLNLSAEEYSLYYAPFEEFPKETSQVFLRSQLSTYPAIDESCVDTLSSHDLERHDSIGGHSNVSTQDSKNPSRIARVTSSTPYSRPMQQPVVCNFCASRPRFRGDHEYQRHYARNHAQKRKIYVAQDISPNGDFLSSCRACQNKKTYNIDYNLTAHLRRQHFQVKKSKKRGGRPNAEEVKRLLDNWGMDWRDQSGCFSMSFCRKWMKCIEVDADEEPSNTLTIVRELEDLQGVQYDSEDEDTPVEAEKQISYHTEIRSPPVANDTLAAFFSLPPTLVDSWPLENTEFTPAFGIHPECGQFTSGLETYGLMLEAINPHEGDLLPNFNTN